MTVSLQDIRSTGTGLPSRGVVYGPEGAGKTSLACAAPKPICLMTKGETGLQTLIDAGRVPETPHFPEIQTWPDLLRAIEVLREGAHDYRTLVLDTLNGAERLCHEHVCAVSFGGRWGNDGFTSFMTGYEVSLAEWRLLLNALDRLRQERRMSIFALAHAKVATFKNPEGPDFDRFTPDLHPKTWGLSLKWVDFALFLNFEQFVDAKTPAKGKGKGGRRRVLHTTRTAAWDAKNRHGLPDEINAGNSAGEAWQNLANAMKTARIQAAQPSGDGLPVSNEGSAQDEGMIS